MSVSSGDSGAGQSNCEWREILANDQAFAVYDVNGKRLTSPTGRWYEHWCEGRQVAVNSAFAVPGAAPVQVDPAVLAAEARESVEVATPSIETSPEADRLLFVQIPTWLWIPGAWWQSYSATAEAGGVSATVVASPTRAVWSTGDGASVTCDGPGTPWREGMSEDASDCRHTYRHSSTTQSSGAYELSVTVEFEVTWTSSVGAGGSLPTITRTVSRAVQVGEIQAIETE